jgi:hypothetical protein
MKIQLGAISSKMTFELETLSQHHHLIERLQDEVFAQRSQIEDLQGRLEEWENNNGKSTIHVSNLKASRNISTTTVNQVPYLNEPVGANWEQHDPVDVKKELGS